MGNVVARRTVPELTQDQNNDSSSERNGEEVFGRDFILGGKRFGAFHPEAFLYGPMADVTFLPTYAEDSRQPIVCESTTVALTAQCHVHKGSLLLVQAKNDISGHAPSPNLYTLQFKFDSLCPCAVSLLIGAWPSLDLARVAAHSPKYFYEAGMQQTFNQPYELDLSILGDDCTQAFSPNGRIPLVVLIEAVSHESAAQECNQEATWAAFEHSEGAAHHSVTACKQYVTANSTCVMLQEIYGLEGCDSDPYQGQACVVCMSDIKDTLVLPCRHLCVCLSCAKLLHAKAARCPICRCCFHSLLQICTPQQSSSLSDTAVGSVVST